jgi:hypothetical protein
MLKNAAVPLLAVVALVAVAGCASRTSTQPSATVAAPADVAGTWTGAVVGAQGAPVTMVLQQTGPKVTGDLRVGGRSDISGPIDGTVEGNTIKLRLQTGAAGTPVMTVRGDEITGMVGGTTLNLRRGK